MLPPISFQTCCRSSRITYDLELEDLWNSSDRACFLRRFQVDFDFWFATLALPKAPRGFGFTVQFPSTDLIKTSGVGNVYFRNIDSTTGNSTL